MKKIHRIITSFICFCLFCFFGSSCQENGDIGDLYGQWQLTSIQHDLEIKSPTGAFLAFQNDCVFARITGMDAHFTYQITGGFSQDKGILKLSFYIDEEKEGAEVTHQYLSTIFGFPLPHNDIKFEIKQLDSSTLVLRNNDVIWQFRSY